MNFKLSYPKRPKYCPESESDRRFWRKRRKTPEKSDKQKNTFSSQYGFVGTQVGETPKPRIKT